MNDIFSSEKIYHIQNCHENVTVHLIINNSNNNNNKTGFIFFEKQIIIYVDFVI